MRQLAASQLVPAEENAAAAELLAAIERLREAPPLGHWNRGLLGGLRSRHPGVVQATVKAAVDRLEQLGEPAAQDDLITAILDACFLNLSGRPRLPSDEQVRKDETRRADAFEQAAGRLVAELSRLLRDRPLELEHHRSRLLARARSIAHLSGRGHLAAAVVDFQHALGEGERSDQRAASELLDARKSELYTSPLTSEATLGAYLDKDRRLPAADTSQELFQIYRLLLACQTKEHARQAILGAMSNLIAWLDQLPQDGAAREPILDEVQRARARVPWEELDVRICRHLEAHNELIPGADHSDDLLVQLRQRYDAAESEDILIRGLELLRRLPLVRARSREICDFVLGHGRRRRSAAVWQAMIELVASLLTGLADFVLTREVLGRRQQSRNRALRRLLVHDDDFRRLLYRLATDDDLEISLDAAVSDGVREHAWRTLLRCLPENRLKLLREGLVERGDRFFFVTLEEAAASRQRELWDVVLGSWDALVEGERPAKDRRRRIQALAEAFRRTRNFDAVQDQGEDVRGAERLGPMVRLALDDGDEAVRRHVEEAVVAAGYGLELQRERQRREILRLRDDLTGTNGRIVELEDEIGRLTREATETQVERADRGLEVQAQLGRRDLIVTDGWLATAGVQVDLEDVRAALVAALAEAQTQLELLHALRQRMQREHRAAREVHGAIQTLVRQQQQLESEIARLERQQSRAERSLANATSEQGRLRSQLGSLSPPSQPTNRGDAERYERDVAAYNNAVARYRSEVNRLQNRIAALGGEISNCRSTIDRCQQGISEAQAAWQRLGQQIQRERSRIAAIRQRIGELEREFQAQQATCEAIRREIARLEAEVRRIEGRFEAERQQRRAQLGENRGLIEGEQGQVNQLHAALQSLSQQLNTTGDDLDRQRTRGQRLVQAIDSGRENYERVAGEADDHSADADAGGFSQQQQTEQAALEEQETLVHYVEGLDRAVRHRPRAAAPRARRQRSGPGET